MPVSSRSRLRGALAKIRRACARAGRTTIASVTSLPKALHSSAFLRGLLCGMVYSALLAGWLALLWFVTAYAHAAEGGQSLSLPDQVKDLATGTGALERPLIGILFTTVGVLFGLLMKSWSDRRAEGEKAALAQTAALAVQEREHLAQLKQKDDQHAEDRAKWHADTTLLQEARVALLREVMQGLTNATSHIQTTQQIIAERSNSSAELTAIVKAMGTTLQSMRESNEGDMRRLSGRISEALEALEARQTTPRKAS